MQSRIVRAIRLFPRLGTMLAGAALALALFANSAHAAPAQTAFASSGNFNSQYANQRQDTDTIAVPVTVLSGNAVSLLGHGNTSANNFSGVVVAPLQSSTQRSSQASSARASNSSSGSSSGKSHGYGNADSQQAYASSGNYNSQSADQSQNTSTVAVPVTLLSGNAISVFGGGNTQANNFSGVVVAPSQSSVQSSKQSSSATADNTRSGNGSYVATHDGGQQAVATSGNYNSQSVSQNQNTDTIAVPITVLSGNAVSVGSRGKTSSNNFSGVVVAPSQSSVQSNSQAGYASAKNTSKYNKYPYRPSNNCSNNNGKGKGGYGKSGSSKHSAPMRAVATSQNVSSQDANQRQKTTTVAVPLTVGSGNALSIGGGKTSSNSFSGVVVAPSQSSAQSSTQHSGASADNVAK